MDTSTDLVPVSTPSTTLSSSAVPTRVPPEVAQHMSVFHPHMTRKLAEIERNQTRFVHYTSAEVALTILKTGKVWMRQTSCMNDVLEVEHGFRCLSSAYKGPHGERLRKTLDSRFPGIVKEIEKQFDDSLNTLRYETFIACLSEHAGMGHEYEDHYGRGSMWRAYGKGKGVALVIKQDPFWTTSTALGAFTSPIAYLNDEGFADELAILANNLETHSAYLDQIGRDWTRHAILHAFHFASVCTKHPGFTEEREWRVISSKALPFPCPLIKKTEFVAGIPQAVLHLELKNDHGMNNMTVPELLDRVIIGPTEYPYPVYDAFLTAMDEAEIPDHHSKLFVSHVPLRATAT